MQDQVLTCQFMCTLCCSAISTQCRFCYTFVIKKTTSTMATTHLRPSDARIFRISACQSLSTPTTLKPSPRTSKSRASDLHRQKREKKAAKTKNDASSAIHILTTSNSVTTLNSARPITCRVTRLHSGKSHTPASRSLLSSTTSKTSS